jgi:hypothetical protein
LRYLIPCGRRAHDIGFHDDIGRAADHQQMFDIVAPYQHQSAAAIDGGGVDHGQARHPSSIGVGTEPIAGESADQPGGDADQCQNRHECEEKCQCLHALSPANSVFFKSLVCRRRAGNRHDKRRVKPEIGLNLLIARGKIGRPLS